MIIQSRLRLEVHRRLEDIQELVLLRLVVELVLSLIVVITRTGIRRGSSRSFLHQSLEGGLESAPCTDGVPKDEA